MPVKNAHLIHHQRCCYEFEAARNAMLAAYANWLYIAPYESARDAIDITISAMRELLQLRLDDAP